MTIVWQGCKSKQRSRAVERVDVDGNRVSVQQMTVINSLEFPVDASQFSLSEEEVDACKTKGIYCKSFDAIVPEFEWGKCMQFLKGLWMEQVSMVLGAAMNVLILVTRPEYDPPSATFVNYQDCIPDCDTKTYRDNMRIMLWVMVATVGYCVRRVIGDGQSVLMWKNLKKKRPERYKSIWIDPADMHAYAHSIYAGVCFHCM